VDGLLDPEVNSNIGNSCADGRGRGGTALALSKWDLLMLPFVKLFRATLTALLMLVVIAGAAVAGPLEDGEAAYHRGDYATMLRLLHPFADQGLAVAQLYLCDMYWDQGDYVEGLKSCHLAAAQGNADAQRSLGNDYMEGLGVTPDRTEAAKWYARAAKGFRKEADQGSAHAQYELGLMYRDGLGVVQDYVQALMWFNLAASRIPASKDDRRFGCDFVIPKMTAAQIAEAQKLTREWKPRSPQIAHIEDVIASTTAPKQNPSSLTGVPLKKEGGTFVVPVQINGAITLDFTVDSGAADVSVPADVFSTLMRTGTIQDTDIIGEQTYVLADGSEAKSITFTIRSLKVGDTVVENVRGNIASVKGSLLLGQTFLEHFKSWSVDNTRHVLLLDVQ
jgi:predicted aspartyl protease